MDTHTSLVVFFSCEHNNCEGLLVRLVIHSNLVLSEEDYCLACTPRGLTSESQHPECCQKEKILSGAAGR